MQKVHLYIIKSLTNTNDSKTLVAENVVASNSASAPIGTTVAEPNGRRRRIERGKICQRLEIDREIAVEGIQVEIGIARVGENKNKRADRWRYLTSWRGRGRAGEMRQRRRASCKHQRYRT